MTHCLRKGLVTLAASLWIMPGGLFASEPFVLTPATAVQLAMEQNESLGMARSDAATAGARVRESRADGLPDLSARFDYTRNWLLPSILFNDNAVKIGSDNEVAGLLRLSQPLYTGGQVSGALQSTRSRVTVAEETERQLRQAIVARVETALYDYLLAEELLRVRSLALHRARANREQVEALRQAGRVTRFEWTRARRSGGCCRVRLHRERSQSDAGWSGSEGRGRHRTVAGGIGPGRFSRNIGADFDRIC
ncbi:MAG: TolC family protein [bacterium]|nr:TolC family protein [bacterium]